MYKCGSLAGCAGFYLLMVSSSLCQQVQEPITLRRVELFPAGQGVFEFDTSQVGDQTLHVSMTGRERDDALKSIVHTGFEDVRVDYRSEESRDIEAFLLLQRDTSATLAELIQGMRGQRIVLTRADGETQGVLVGVEQQFQGDEGGNHPCEVVTLRTERGLERVVLDNQLRVSFASEEVQSRFDRMLARSQGVALDRLPVSIRVDKKKPGKSTIAFALETAPWKCAYRLASAGDRYELQASAVIDNNSGLDWEDVELVLVVDQLLGFHAPLSQIQSWGRGSMALPAPFSASPPKLVAGRKERDLSLIVNAPQGGMGGMGGGMGGMGGMRGMGGGMGTGGMGGSMGGSGVDDPFDSNEIATASSRESRLGISFSTSELTKASFGQRVHIRIPHVTLLKGSSTTIFFPSIPHQMEDVRVYSPQVHAQHPLSAFEIKLTEKYQLPGGPGSVWKEHGYAGDVMIPRLVAGVPQLVTYALDSKIEIKHEVPNAIDERQLPSSWEFQEDRIIENLKFQRTHSYRIQNEGTDSHWLFIEHVANRDEWVPEPTDALVATEDKDTHRYRVRVPAAGSINLEVPETKKRVIQWSKNSSASDLRSALRQPEMGRPDMEAQARVRLEELLKTITAAERVAQRTQQLSRELELYAKEQTRIKGLMAVLVRGDALHTRYLGKLDELESQIESSQKELAGLQ